MSEEKKIMEEEVSENTETAEETQNPAEEEQIDPCKQLLKENEEL